MYVLFADRVSGKKLAYYSCHPDDFMDAAFTAWTKLIQHTEDLKRFIYPDLKQLVFFSILRIRSP